MKNLINHLLTLLLWVFILISCFLYIYVIIRLIKPKSHNFIIQLLLPHIQNIIKPLFALDTLIRETIGITTAYTNILKYIISKKYLHTNKIQNYLKSENITFHLKLYIKWYIVYFIFSILPRVLLAGALIIDVFYFNQVLIFYNILIIGLIPLIYTYIIYSLRLITKQYIEYLDTWYLVEIIFDDNENNYYYERDLIDWDHNKLTPNDYPQYYLKISKLLTYQTEAILNGYTPYTYICRITWATVEKYKINTSSIDDLSIEQRTLLENDYHTLMPLTTMLHTFFEIQDTMLWLKKISLVHKIIMVNMISLYFIAWTYILITSLQLLSISPIEAFFLINFKDTLEPFSDTCLFDISSAKEPNIDDYLLIITLSIGSILLVYWYNVYKTTIWNKIKGTWENNKN